MHDNKSNGELCRYPSGSQEGFISAASLDSNIWIIQMFFSNFGISAPQCKGPKVKMSPLNETKLLSPFRRMRLEDDEELQCCRRVEYG